MPSEQGYDCLELSRKCGLSHGGLHLNNAMTLHTYCWSFNLIDLSGENGKRGWGGEGGEGVRSLGTPLS